MGARATSDTDNNTLYTINTLHDKRAPHATTNRAEIACVNVQRLHISWAFTTYSSEYGCEHHRVHHKGDEHHRVRHKGDEHLGCFVVYHIDNHVGRVLDYYGWKYPDDCGFYKIPQFENNAELLPGQSGCSRYIYWIGHLAKSAYGGTSSKLCIDPWTNSGWLCTICIITDYINSVLSSHSSHHV